MQETTPPLASTFSFPSHFINAQKCVHAFHQSSSPRRDIDCGGDSSSYHYWRRMADHHRAHLERERGRKKISELLIILE